MPSHSDLLASLLATTRASEVAAILKALGDSPEARVDEPFGSGIYCWHFYGNTDSNFSTIHIASKPGRSLTERITNAIDAVLEARMAQGGPTPQSPMEAAKSWFGRPPTTADSGLFSWKDYKTPGYDQLVQLALSTGDEKANPTVDIIDAGIGIRPEDFAGTILSLQRGNKMKKPYLVGAFGQGGSATLRFSSFTLIVSRALADPNTVAFTIIRMIRLPEPYKMNAYVFLSLARSPESPSVPSCKMDSALDPFPSIPDNGLSPIAKGTLVRHYGYNLRGLENPLQASPGNIYHLCQCMMFDPLIPFRIYDLRGKSKETKPKREIILGSRNRLMKYVAQTDDKDDEPSEEIVEGGDSEKPTRELRHHFPREMVSLLPDSSPSVGIEYWVVLNRRKSGEKLVLRNSSELFVERGHPFVGTLHGQNHGDRTDLLLRELELPTVAKHIIIHIDATLADRDTRLDLFSSTREGFAEGDAYKELMRLLRDMLKDDDELFVIENELIEATIQRITSEVDKEVKREILDLLREAGLQIKDSGETIKPGEGKETADAPKGRKHHKGTKPLPPLPTLPYPQVTKLSIVFPSDKLSIPLNARYLVRIETDADFRFDREVRIAIRSDPLKLEVASKSGLHGGRMKWRLRPVDTASVGDTGHVIVTITKPNGEQLSAEILFEILPPIEAKGTKAKGLVPPFDVIPVDPYSDEETFERLWPSTTYDDIPTVAYKAEKLSGKIFVYYSTAFRPYRTQLTSLASQPSTAQLLEHYYKIWIGYHAILQEIDKPFEPQFLAEPADDERPILDRYLPEIREQIEERERALVAEMQVKQAFKTAELKARLMKETSS